MSSMVWKGCGATLPRLANPVGSWRTHAFSEADYAWRPARLELSLAPDQARGYLFGAW